MISEEKDFNQNAVPYLYLCIYLLLHTLELDWVAILIWKPL